jgi:hypothetical protein
MGRSYVQTDLYRQALRDAIAWQLSILETHDPDRGNQGLSSCCKPGARCEDYRREWDRLGRYRSALTGIERSTTFGRP